MLAYSAPQLRDGVLRVEGAKLELTAVVEPMRTVSDDPDGRGDGAVPVRRGGDGAAGDSGDDGERSGAGRGDGADGVEGLSEFG